MHWCIDRSIWCIEALIVVYDARTYLHPYPFNPYPFNGPIYIPIYSTDLSTSLSIQRSYLHPIHSTELSASLSIQRNYLHRFTSFPTYWAECHCLHKHRRSPVCGLARHTPLSFGSTCHFYRAWSSYEKMSEGKDEWMRIAGCIQFPPVPSVNTEHNWPDNNYPVTWITLVQA